MIAKELKKFIKDLSSNAMNIGSNKSKDPLTTISIDFEPTVYLT
jgi:hypothetical protein